MTDFTKVNWSGLKSKEDLILGKKYLMATALITVSKVAELFGCNAATVYRMVKQGDIPYHKVGKQYRFNQEDVLNGTRIGGCQLPSDDQRRSGPLTHSLDSLHQTAGKSQRRSEHPRRRRVGKI